MNVNSTRYALISLVGILCLASCQKQNDVKSSVKSASFYDQVTTTEGPVQGTIDNDLVIFKGIPYAAAPVDGLRWRAPQPAAKRQQLLVADSYGDRCIQRPQNNSFPQQPEAFTQPENEDCLYLNIFRPKSTDAKLPVMVWLPGGGLVGGSGSRPVNHGGNLAEQGVLVVSINYRLGSFGFFAHPSLSIENPDKGKLYNYGLMDQIAALQWIQDNISEFGGDPSNVTIFGESAGAYSVDMLVASQAGTGLFAKAISQSGYGRGEQPRVASLSQDPENAIEQMGVKLAEKLAMPSATVDELRAVAAVDIVKATDFSSFIEFAVDGVVIKDDMTTLYQQGLQAKVPMLLGANDFEFGMVPPATQQQIMAKELPAEAMDELVSYYGSEVLRDTLLYSDFGFHSQIRELALAHEKQGNATYVYRFSMPGKWSQSLDTPDGKVYGSPHAADMPYVFGNFTGDHMEPTEPSEQQLATSALMMSYWTNFAKHGDPNGDTLPKWPQYNGDTIMHFIPEGSQAQTDTWVRRLDKVNSYLH